MTVLTTIPNGASLADIRATINQALADVAALKAGGGTTLPTLNLSGAQSHNEGNSGPTLFTYTVTRSSSSGAVTVPWSFAAGSTSANDFTGGSYPAGGTVTMADGVSTATFSVSVNGDTTAEPDEQFTVSITAPSGYQLGTSSATGTIVNDDSSVTALPTGASAIWDAASLSALANGAAVTTWTDSVGGAVATQTGDSTTSHTFIANSGGLPAVRLSGAAVLTTAGTNAAATAMAGTDRTMLVVMRNIQGLGSGQANPVMASCGNSATNGGWLLQATTTQTGLYTNMFDCADAGMRTVGLVNAQGTGSGDTMRMVSINGTAIKLGYGTNEAGQVAIGGWQQANTSCCGVADILAVIIYPRALTAAELKQVHRRYCELLGQTRPGGGTQRNVSFIGDSLTAGYETSAGKVVFADSYPYQMVQGLNLPWGTWDQLGYEGDDWTKVLNRQAARLGNISGATGNRSIVCMFEFANMNNAASAESGAQAAITALHNADSNREIIFGTSTDDGSTAGVSARTERTNYDGFWDTSANRTGITSYVQIHLDANIGVQGSAPTGGGNTYYQSDGLHLTRAGYALLDNGPQGFRSAVSARLAA